MLGPLPICLVVAAVLLKAAALPAKLQAIERCSKQVQNAVADDKSILDENAGLSPEESLKKIEETVKKVCSASDATKTISFINANSGTLTAINEFMSTLSTQEFEKFTAMQRNGDFSDILKFVKEKADTAPQEQKAALTSLMHSLVPSLLNQQDVLPDEVLRVLNGISLDELIQVLAAAESKDIDTLVRILQPEIKQLKFTSAQRDKVLAFVRSINNIHEQRNPSSA
ncbi:hypothetical protein AAVH_08976 [Aphelenchoides avenae]|nr:hypothetical protein AAVH_08976 [Aphelenchus avenae]